MFNERQKRFLQDRKENLIRLLGEQRGLEVFRYDVSYVEANIPLKFIDFSFDKYDIEIGDDIAKRKIEEYSNQIEEMLRKGTGLYLCGDHGRGKTILASEVLKSAIRKGYSAYFITMGEIVETFTEAWFSTEARKFLVDKISSVEFLVIDELMNEYAGKIEILRAAFNAMFRPRSNNLCCTILTSNKSMNEIETFYGTILSSLVRESLKQIVFMPGRDYRTVIATTL